VIANLKTAFSLQVPAKVLEIVAAKDFYPPAILAKQQVSVAFKSRNICTATVRMMDALHQTQVFEFFECPINGYEPEPFMAGTPKRKKVRWGDGIIRFCQSINHRAACSG
jgi:hypothetical protein